MAGRSPAFRACRAVRRWPRSRVRTSASATARFSRSRSTWGSRNRPTRRQCNCGSVYGIPNDKNGDHFCVTNVNPNVWLGSPDYLLMPTLNCNPASGLKASSTSTPPASAFRCPVARRAVPTALSSNPTGQGVYRLPYIHGPAYSRHDLTLLKNFQVKEKQNLQLRLAAFNFVNHPLTSFNNNDTEQPAACVPGRNGGNAPDGQQPDTPELSASRISSTALGCLK